MYVKSVSIADQSTAAVSHSKPASAATSAMAVVLVSLIEDTLCADSTGLLISP